MLLSGSPSRFTVRALIPTIFGAALLITCWGCGGTPRQTEFMKSQENVVISSSELRVRLYDFANAFAGEVEQTADGIIAGTDDKEIQRRAVRWKISAGAEVFKAVFGRDPLGAYTDTWAFSKQMYAFLDNGAGRDLFGEQQPQAVATARILEMRIKDLGVLGSASGDISGLEDVLDPWVAQHPLHDLHFVRESTTPMWANFVASKGGGMAVVGRMEESLQDMIDRLDILADNLRKQARWETELMMDDALSSGELGEFFARVDTMDVNLERIREVFDDLEPILTRQIQALMTTGGELTERERILAMEFWRVERDFLLARLETIQADAFDRLAVERALILQEIEASAGMTVANSMTGMESLIDHLVLRLAQLAGGLMLLAGLLVLIIRRTRHSSPE